MRFRPSFVGPLAALVLAGAHPGTAQGTVAQVQGPAGATMPAPDGTPAAPAPVQTPDATAAPQEPPPAPAAPEAPQDGVTVVPVRGSKALGMSILGNQEAPTSLVIVPWKTSELGDSLGVSTLLDDSKQPVDRDVFMRALRYYEIRSEPKAKP